MNRVENISYLKKNIFDICVIGGGASGAGCALDARLRGLKVALIEGDDFAAKTSSRSTKLIHGGVRYLEQSFKNLDFGQLRQVKHGLEERATLLRNAPHLAQPLELLTPCHNWFEAFYFSVGLKLYGWFAKNDFMPKSHWINGAKTFGKMSNLNSKVHSSIVYYDGQLDDARYCLAIAKTAAEKGVYIANHILVIDFQRDINGKLTAVLVKDELTGEEFMIRAKVFINCTGSSTDIVRQKANPSLEARISRSKGVHALLPLGALGTNTTALLIPETTDGRVVFAIPWEGKLLVGTTDTPYNEASDEPNMNDEEADFLINNLNLFLAKPVGKNQILAGFGGLRPLLNAKNRNTKQLLRDHEVEIDEKSGLISLMGGKWTTYRLMARDTVDAAAAKLGNTAPCLTEHQLLCGAENYQPDAWSKFAQRFDLEEDIAKYLLQKYGSRADSLFAKANKEDLKQRLVAGYPYIKAEVLYAVEEEMACTLEDVLARRLRLAFLDWGACQEAIPMTAALMSQKLGWSEEKKNQEIAFFTNKIKTAKEALSEI